MSPRSSTGPVSSFAGMEQSSYRSIGKCNWIHAALRNARFALRLWMVCCGQRHAAMGPKNVTLFRSIAEVVSP